MSSTLVGLPPMARAGSYPAVLCAAALIGLGSAVLHPEASRVARAAAMWCVIGAPAALRQRDATGRGRVVDTSLFESAVAWVETPLNGYLATGSTPARRGTGSANLVPYQTFDTADRPVCVAAGHQRLWVKFARAAGHPEWAEDARFRAGRERTANRAALVEAIRPVPRERTRERWIDAFARAGVPRTPVNDVAELAAAPQLAAVDLLREVPGAGLRVVGPPVAFGRERPHPRAAAPAPGRANGTVLGAGKADDGDDAAAPGRAMSVGAPA